MYRCGMALKSRYVHQTWRAKGNAGTDFGGSNMVMSDELITSVGHRFPFRDIGPFESRHTQLSGSLGIYHNQNNSTKAKFLEPFGPSSFGSAPLGKCSTNIPSAADIYARTNPSRASVLLPVFFLELREIPDMIRFVGRVLLNPKKWGPSAPGRVHLAVQFGWLPLIRDLITISGLQKSVDRRRKEFDRLYSGNGLKRRIGLGAGAEVVSYGKFLNFGTYRNFNALLTENRSYRAWAVVNWRPTNPSSLPPSDAALMRRMTGLTASHITEAVWEALPWSWLIDWFTNVGSVIKAGNRADARPNGGCVMVQYTSTATHPSYTQFNDLLTAGKLTTRWNTRAPLGASVLTAKLPILTASQVSILGALASARIK